MGDSVALFNDDAHLEEWASELAVRMYRYLHPRKGKEITAKTVAELPEKDKDVAIFTAVLNISAAHAETASRTISVPRRVLISDVTVIKDGSRKEVVAAITCSICPWVLNVARGLSSPVRTPRGRPGWFVENPAPQSIVSAWGAGRRDADLPWLSQGICDAWSTHERHDIEHHNALHNIALLARGWVPVPMDVWLSCINRLRIGKNLALIDNMSSSVCWSASGKSMWVRPAVVEMTQDLVGLDEFRNPVPGLLARDVARIQRFDQQWRARRLTDAARRYLMLRLGPAGLGPEPLRAPQPSHGSFCVRCKLTGQDHDLTAPFGVPQHREIPTAHRAPRCAGFVCSWLGPAFLRQTPREIHGPLWLPSNAALLRSESGTNEGN